MPFSLTATDFVYAAALALVFTVLINTLSKVFKLLITRSAEFSYNPNNMDDIMEKCRLMFPIDNVRFNGTTFQRGMRVKAVTSHKRIIEGELIGANNDNMICFITQRSVVAQELDKIEDMVSL